MSLGTMIANIIAGSFVTTSNMGCPCAAESFVSDLNKQMTLHTEQFAV